MPLSSVTFILRKILGFFQIRRQTEKNHIMKASGFQVKKKLFVDFNAYVRANNCAKRAAVAVLFIFKNAVMVARLVEIIGHHKNGPGTRMNTELTPLTAFFLDDDPFHKSLHIPHEINRAQKPLSPGKRKGKLFYKIQYGTIKIIG